MFDALQKLFDTYNANVVRQAGISEAFFKIKLLLFGYFDPTNIFLIIKVSNVRGGLSDISAKTATLSGMLELEGTCVTSICSVVFF